MKLLLLPLLLLSSAALAQQPARSADSFRYAPRQVDHALDSLPAWSDYRPRYYNVNECYCPLPEQPVGDPRNGPSPYHYLKMDKPIVIDSQTDSTWRKAEQDFIQDYQRADSLLRQRKATLVL